MATTGELARFLKFLEHTEGRDKLTKCVQYGCRGGSYILEQYQVYTLSKKLFNLCSAASDSRKIFRIGKFLNEYMKLKQLSKGLVSTETTTSPPKAADATACAVNPLVSFVLSFPACVKDSKCQYRVDYEKLLLFVSRGGFLLYWIFDALSILTKMKVIEITGAKQISTKAGKGWFVGLLFGILYEAYRLRKSYQRENRLYKQLASQYDSTSANNVDAHKNSCSKDELDSCEIEKLLIGESVNRETYYLNIVKNTGDLVTASNMIGIPEKLTGKPLNDGIIGIGGLISGLISCAQIYPKNLQ